MKNINFTERTWEQVKSSYNQLKTRYKTVKFPFSERRGNLLSGYFVVK